MTWGLVTLAAVLTGLRLAIGLVLVFRAGGYAREPRYRVLTERLVVDGLGRGFGVQVLDQRELRVSPAIADPEPIVLNREMRRWCERQRRRGLHVAFDERGMPYSSPKPPRGAA